MKSVFKSVHVLKRVFRVTPKYLHIPSFDFRVLELLGFSETWCDRRTLTADCIPLSRIRYRGNSV